MDGPLPSPVSTRKKYDGRRVCPIRKGTMKIKNAVLILVCFVLGYASFSAAQQTTPLDTSVTASAAPTSPTSNPTSSVATTANSEPSASPPGSGGPPQIENAPDDQWHLS